MQRHVNRVKRPARTLPPRALRGGQGCQVRLASPPVDARVDERLAALQVRPRPASPSGPRREEESVISKDKTLEREKKVVKERS